MAKVLKGAFGRRDQPGKDKTGSDQPIPGYQFKMSLTFSDPMIWRRLQVPGEITLAELSQAIQICMDWHDTETHQFLVGKIFYSPGFGISNQERLAEYDEANFKLHELEEPMHFIFTYLYDGGEGWELDISLEEVFPEGFTHSHPRLLDGERACPPASIGDIHQYQALLAALESGGADGKEITLNDHHGYTFHPDSCDKDMINDRLKNLPG
jgi:hypothetical protein